MLINDGGGIIMKKNITKKLAVALCATMLCGAFASVTSAGQGAYSAPPSFGFEGNTNTDYTYDEDVWTDEESNDYITVNPEETLEEIYANCPEGYEVKFIAWVNLETKTEGRSYYYSKVSTQTGDEDSSFDEGSVEPAIAEVITVGDLDKDGKITLNDVSFTLKVALGVEEETQEIIKAADTNGNGKVDMDDVGFILKYSLGIYYAP